MDTREETATRKNNCLKYINKHFLFKLSCKKDSSMTFFHSGNLSRLPKVDKSVDRCVTVLFRGPSKLESVLDSIDCSKSAPFMQRPQNDPVTQVATKIATFELFFLKSRKRFIFSNFSKTRPISIIICQTSVMYFAKKGNSVRNLFFNLY